MMIKEDKNMNELDQLKEDIAMESYGRSRTLCLAGGQCVKCGTYDLTFRDELSRKEYQLTVWCQSCQDEFFGKFAEDEVEDDFRDMMPTSEEYWYEAQPEPYEPNCYDGTYSEE